MLTYLIIHYLPKSISLVILLTLGVPNTTGASDSSTRFDTNMVESIEVDGSTDLLPPATVRLGAGKKQLSDLMLVVLNLFCVKKTSHSPCYAQSFCLV